MYTHCMAHRINLVIVDLSKNIEEINANESTDVAQAIGI